MASLDGGIAESLKNKSILLTGSTGFLAKIFVEKVLRVQPQVKRLFLIVRAADLKSATLRIHDEVLKKDLFRVLKEKHGSGFESFFWSKVSPVVGDIAMEGLGMVDACVQEEISRDVDVIVNVAATTSFDERYDSALRINALGAKHVLDFAKTCQKLEMLLHVSTAYVAGSQTGLIPETAFRMGQTLAGNSTLDIEAEVQLMTKRLEELRADGATKEAERSAMKHLGLQRAKLFGWPNTYVFTKAMGEMLIGEKRGDIPVVILRPTVIESTYYDPFPGWMEGTRTVDSLLVNYCKGKLTSFLANGELILDVIPGDMVVNSMIVSMAVHLGDRGSQFIYHVGSSVQNPVRYSKIIECAYRYFKANPCYGKDGKPIIVKEVSLFSNMESFRRYMALYHKLPLGGLYLANQAFCKLFNSTYNNLTRKYNFVMYLAELYEPYVFFKGRFEDKNSDVLRSKINDSEAKLFHFDPKSINWEDYIMKIHIPGIIKYVLR
ncbi:Fatty acyl-CoA reductase 3 [Nymphaea thermarum]|nr:Fatty acyl-CoA reductase 3 [Nymphaea thermarum]